jgi:hypothetical protein
MKTLFLAPASSDDLQRLLRAWRFWLAGALAGALLGAAVYALFPPDYRARATVVVDFNAEQSWPVKSDRELFYYLERETLKLEEVAWSDATLQQIAAETGLSVAELRDGRLELGQPGDGGWHFYATDASAGRAEQLASAWARSFHAQVQQGIADAVALDAARQALETDPADPGLVSRIDELESRSLAITPELQIALAQSKDLPVVRKTGVGTYAISGAGIFLALAALAVLFVKGK